MVLDLILGGMLYAQSLNPSLQPPTFYDRTPYIMTQSHAQHPDQITISQSGCHDVKEMKSLLPKYELENLVAEFLSPGKLIDEYSDEFVAGKDFDCRVYDSKSKINQNSVLKKDGYPNFMPYLEEQILKLLQTSNFDIIEFYERDNLNRLHSKPSAIIYINRTNGITYIIFDLEGQKSLADGKFDTKCYDYWSPDLITKTADDIVEKKLKKPGIAPIPPF